MYTTVVLILNGHNEEKIPSAIEWLELLPKLPNLKVSTGFCCVCSLTHSLAPFSLAKLSFPFAASLQGAGVILLAQEDCENAWLRPYLDNPKYKIKFMFMVYGGKVRLTTMCLCE